MALKVKRVFSEDEIRAGMLMMCDPGGFARGVMGMNWTTRLKWQPKHN